MKLSRLTPNRSARRAAHKRATLRQERPQNLPHRLADLWTRISRRSHYRAIRRIP